MTDVYSTQAKTRLKLQIEKYLRFGGYPETVLINPELAQKNLAVLLRRHVVS